MVILPHTTSRHITREWGIKLGAHLLHFAHCLPSPRKHILPIPRLSSFFRPRYQNAKRYGWQWLSFRTVYMECIRPLFSKNHVFRFCVISVADSSDVHWNISIYEMRLFILTYIEIACHSLAAQKIHKVEPFLAKSLFNIFI